MPEKSIEIGQTYSDITAGLTLDIVSIDATYSESWSVWDVRIIFEILEHDDGEHDSKSVHLFGKDILEGILVLQDEES